MYAILFNICLLAATVDAETGVSADMPKMNDNPIFVEMLEKGVPMSDGALYKLPKPVMGDDLDAEGQKAAIAKIGGNRYTLEDLLRKNSAAPVVVTVRTLKTAEGESSIVRAIDLWFVAYGKWDVLNSKEFQESLAKNKDTESDNKTMSKSGILSTDELDKRHLKLESSKGQEAKFIYGTFSLFDQVEVSATRYAVVIHDKDFMLAAGRIDKRFADDADYPNQWRPILRDAAANISLGEARPYSGGGAYAKITKLIEPADAIFVECHIVFEEPYGWFEGGNLLRSKVPTVVQQRARMFRSKFSIASVKQE